MGTFHNTCLWGKVSIIFTLPIGKVKPRREPKRSHSKVSLSWLIDSFLFHQKMEITTQTLMSKYKDLPQNSPQSRYAGSFHSVYLTSDWRGVFDEGVGEKTGWQTIIKTHSKSQQLQSEMIFIFMNKNSQWQLAWLRSSISGWTE